MKMRVVIAVASVLLCVGVIAAMMFSMGSGKRKAPPAIKSVVIGGVEYRAPNTIQTEGVVEAWNANPPKLLWKKNIYSTVKLPSLLMETDVQFNFITNMTVGPATNELTISNEKGRQYILNIASQKVTNK